MPEGTVIYPNEPIITVTAPLIDAQLVETAILTQINHQSLVATKAQRIVRAARGRGVSDFGARRAHNMDAAVYGARAAYIGGADSTATVLAGKMFGIPVSGTMAHSWVMFHDDEYTAFKRFAMQYPDNTVLLVDSYDVLKSGVPNAIRVAKEVLEPMGKRLKGIRLDSGDLTYLSKEARKMLDAAGFEDCKIMASNSLDEFTIRSLLDQGACIDAFGVGERMITAKSDPVFGAVHKLVAVNNGQACRPKIKISETFEKITNPGRKHLWRVYDRQGIAVADLITQIDEIPDLSKPYRFVDPQRPWKQNVFEGCTAKRLLHPVMRDGIRTTGTTGTHPVVRARDDERTSERTEERRSLDEIRSFVRQQLDHEIWESEQRFENPHIHYLDMSPTYYEMKMDLLAADGKVPRTLR